MPLFVSFVVVVSVGVTADIFYFDSSDIIAVVWLIV